MDSIAEIARTCFNKFGELTDFLANAKAENRESMPPDKLEWEFSRFKLWCGNLGALQVGNSSLDSRLRESTVIRTNVFKHLLRLSRTLVESTEVVSNARLPFEKQPQVEDSNSGSSSEESESDDEPPKELVLHMASIKEILSDLYMLSFRIRNSSTRPTSTLRIDLYTEIEHIHDGGTTHTVDKLAAYTEFDKRHIEDLLLQLRRDAANEMQEKPSKIPEITDGDSYLIERLVATMDKRRRFLRYWQRHAKKMAEIPKEAEIIMKPQSMSKLQPEKSLVLLDNPGKRVQFAPTIAGKTIFSKTEATRFDKRLDDTLETRSVISYASARVESDGGEIELPPPPVAVSKGTEFMCPYCGIMCPARHGKGAAWKAHVLRDLQPYICTYDKCEDGNRIFNSRTVWLEHERLSHRRIWQCFEHLEPIFNSKAALQAHLKIDHGNDITDEQIENLIEICALSVEDTRDTCPFCFFRGPFPAGLGNHMASHMQRLATFPVSRDISGPNDEEEEDTGVSEKTSDRVPNFGSRGSLRSASPRFGSEPPSDVALEHGDLTGGRVRGFEYVLNSALGGSEDEEANIKDELSGSSQVYREEDYESSGGHSQLSSEETIDIESRMDSIGGILLNIIAEFSKDKYGQIVSDEDRAAVTSLMHETEGMLEALDASKRSSHFLSQPENLRMLINDEGWTQGKLSELNSLLAACSVQARLVKIRIMTSIETPKVRLAAIEFGRYREQILGIFRDLDLRRVRLRVPFVQEAVYDFGSSAHGRETLEFSTQANVQSRIRKWAKDLQGKPILLLFGSAGAGKSTIARNFAQEMEGIQLLGASFFFRSDYAECNNASGFVTTIALQLLQRIPDLLPYMTAEVDEDPMIASRPLTSQFDTLIFRPFSKIARMQAPFILVIDALDECQAEDDILEILGLLRRLQDLAPPNSEGNWLRVLLTSRSAEFLLRTPDVLRDILQVLYISNGEDKAAIYIILDDLFSRIRLEILKNLPESRLQEYESWPGEQVLTILLNMANGKFSNVMKICQFLDATFTGRPWPEWNPRKRLDIILEYGKTGQIPKVEGIEEKDLQFLKELALGR
ncbi:Checkpoint kinase 2 [Orbilia oligospora]|uniref:Checkpoint kinase 2 n=1 Tax=Orbilia oligospora TaxID=2813651 RepID=A0A8H2HKN4_ORBOL|nr:Checkpoint kinase 2 [Orbilia oligospora]